MSQRGILSRISRQKVFVKDCAYATFTILSWLPAVILFNTHVAEITPVNGVSMFPFFNSSYYENQSHDVCLVYKWNVLQNLQRGMVVTFRTPHNPETIAVKRIVALEYDRVQTRAPYPFPIAEIPTGHVWVEGDNEDGTKTMDSNHYGPIPTSLIIGRVTHKLLPWSTFGQVPWWEFRSRTKVWKVESSPESK